MSSDSSIAIAEKAGLSERLGHQFRDKDLLKQALTHRSFHNEYPNQSRGDNERMEFLGDAVIGAVVGHMLYEHFPDTKEGELTRRRANLVNESALADIAEDLKLGEELRLGRGEIKTGGQKKPRLLASAFEALIGAVQLDGGSAVSEQVVRTLFASRISLSPSERDPKSRLQELLQASQQNPPTYELQRSEGPDHDRIFYVSVKVGEVATLGRGRSKLEAEQKAAKEALRQLRSRNEKEAKS